MDVLALVLAATGTALATGLGALPVWWLAESADRLRPALWGLTIGVMGVASIVGLLQPAIDIGSTAAVAGGVVAGTTFLLVSRHELDARSVSIAGLSGPGVRRSVLVFAVLLVHSLPEGLAIGTAYASAAEGLGLFVILAIAFQNVPEGTSVAIPMASAGFSRARQFWAAVATSAPQPVGALIAYVLVEHVGGLLPVSFAFAAGAMLALVVVELTPAAFVRGRRALAAAGVVVGGLSMLALAAVFGV